MHLEAEAEGNSHFRRVYVFFGGGDFSSEENIAMLEERKKRKFSTPLRSWDLAASQGRTCINPVSLKPWTLRK